MMSLLVGPDFRLVLVLAVLSESLASTLVLFKMRSG